MPHAVAIIPFGIVGAYLANVFRIAALVVIGAKLSPDVAIGGFHSKSGWVFTCGLALGLLVWVRHSPTFSREGATARRENGSGSVNTQENPTVPYLAPLMLNLGLLLLTGAGVASFDLLGPLRVLVVAIFIAWLPWRRIGLKRWTFSGYPVLLGVVVFVVWVSLVQPDSADASNVIPGLATLSPAGRAVWLSARIFGAAVVAPIVEELAFRGFLLRRLFQPDFDRVPYATAGRQVWPLLASSVVFGAMHQSFIAGSLAGVAYGLALVPRGRLADAVVAHVVTNAMLAIYVVATSRWYLLA